MIDSHCHLTDPRLLEQLPDVLRRADEAGVTKMITIGTTPADARAAIGLCRAHPRRVRCAVGVHPNHSHEVGDDAIEQTRQLLDDEHVVAAGEMGLDYHWDFADRATQRRLFVAQLALAREAGKPLVIHCREATEDTLAILKDHADLPAVFHCFTGSAGEAEAILDGGYLLGFTGPITFKRSGELRAVVARTPRDRLLVETDAPYLAPEPMRKFRTNEPAWVVHVADAVASAWGVGRAEVDAITTANVQRLFGWGG